MKEHSDKNIILSTGDPKRRCLSCGTPENMARRRYCSIDCRQRLHKNLNMRTGLLKALQTRYATFYFTEAIIVMDVLPWGSKELYSYIFPRTYGEPPVDAYIALTNILGNAWWAERNRTNKRYLASQLVIEKAKGKDENSDTVKPIVSREPVRLKKSLTFLKLKRADLGSPGLQDKIKTAYRRQAKKYHPDQGGDAALFRKLHKAYEQLARWAENPVFTTRRGFPDKWFYDGGANRWYQPTAIRKAP